MKEMTTVPPCEAKGQLLCHFEAELPRLCSGSADYFSLTHRGADLCRLALCCQHTSVTLAMLNGIKWSGKIGTDKMCRRKWVTEMGYFKVRAREQFVAPNEKADETTARVKCNHGLSLCLQHNLWKINNKLNKCISAGGPWVLISGASIAHLFCAALH